MVKSIHFLPLYYYYGVPSTAAFSPILYLSSEGEAFESVSPLLTVLQARWRYKLCVHTIYLVYRDDTEVVLHYAHTFDVIHTVESNGETAIKTPGNDIHGQL